MGTDIHGVFQRKDKTTGKWEDIPSKYEQDRHYQLFAVLANVRNGFGFAGVRTGEAVPPIAMPRGLPEDFPVNDDCHPIALENMDPRRREWHREGEPLEVWMGDHSFSWLTGDEMLAWYENAPEVEKTGILSRECYDEWDGRSPPREYCGGVSGPNVVLIGSNADEKARTPNWNYISCSWKVSLKQELAYFFDEVKRLVDQYGEIRFVFGFDS